MKRATPHLVALAFLPTIAWGQAVSFDVAGDNERLTEILQSASLVESLDPTENPAPQDYIAAARADSAPVLAFGVDVSQDRTSAAIVAAGRDQEDAEQALAAVELPDA